MKLGIEYGNYNDEAVVVDLDHNDMPSIFRLCLNKNSRESSDYPRKEVIKIANIIVKTFNVIQKLKEIL